MCVDGVSLKEKHTTLEPVKKYISFFEIPNKVVRTNMLYRSAL